MATTKNTDIGILLKARQTLLWVVTREELRVERAVMESAAKAGFKTVLWDCADGVVDATGKPYGPGKQGVDPEVALGAIAGDKVKAVWVLRDLHRWLNSPPTVRRLKTLARDLESAPANQERAIVVLSASAEVPEDLRGLATVIDWPLPDREEVGRILTATVNATLDGIRSRAADPKVAAKIVSLEATLKNGAFEAAVDAAVGLTAKEIADCYARSLVSSGKIDADAIRGDKASVISRERVLEWYDPDPRGLDAIGGLDGLKSWLKARRTAFSPKAREFGLPAPKGVLLVGVPGCGKSLTAKAVASAWGMPLLRLDLGALKSKFVGESEGNIRKALKTAESVAPCILWLDEIEKALAGSTGPQGDGGVSSDALGAILTWLQERAGAVFCVATSNDVSALPPELLRKGRFDDIFFVDLPTAKERAAILTTTLKQFKRDGKSVDIDAIVNATHEFTGAEIAALIPDALFGAFADGERALTTADIIEQTSLVVPLAKTASEKIGKLREWAKGRARLATPEAAATAPASLGRAVNID